MIMHACLVRPKLQKQSTARKSIDSHRFQFLACCFLIVTREGDWGKREKGSIHHHTSTRRGVLHMSMKGTLPGAPPARIAFALSPRHPSFSPAAAACCFSLQKVPPPSSSKFPSFSRRVLARCLRKGFQTATRSLSLLLSRPRIITGISSQHAFLTTQSGPQPLASTLLLPESPTPAFNKFHPPFTPPKDLNRFLPPVLQHTHTLARCPHATSMREGG